MNLAIDRPTNVTPPPRSVRLNDIVNPGLRIVTVDRAAQHVELHAVDSRINVDMVFKVPYDVALQWANAVVEIAEAGPYREPGA